MRKRRDIAQVAWSHDEFQFDHKKGLGEVVGTIAQETIREASNILGFRAELRAGTKTGGTWAETH